MEESQVVAGSLSPARFGRSRAENLSLFGHFESSDDQNCLPKLSFKLRN
jgi:hypothetical protein